jgi:hypothetical protein
MAIWNQWLAVRSRSGGFRLPWFRWAGVPTENFRKLGFEVSERTVARYQRGLRRRGDPGKRWLASLQNHREVIVVCDFFTVPHKLAATTSDPAFRDSVLPGRLDARPLRRQTHGLQEPTVGHLGPGAFSDSKLRSRCFHVHSGLYPLAASLRQAGGRRSGHWVGLEMG